MELDRLTLKYDGNRVTQVQVRFGDEVRPLWAKLSSMSPAHGLKWVSRFSPFEAIAAEWALAGLVESAAEIVVPERAQVIRITYLEVQRMLWGIQYFSRIFKCLTDDIRFQQCLHLREQIFDLQEILTGSRVLPQIFCLGGVERDLSIGEIKKIRGFLRQFEYETRLYFRSLGSDLIFMSRLKDLLPLSPDMARQMNLFGPFGQASGLAQDLRVSPRGEKSSSSYASLSVSLFNGSETADWLSGGTLGDGLYRFRSVLFQIKQSLNLVEACINKIPEGPYRCDLKEEVKYPMSLSTFAVESGSGPLSAHCENGKIKLLSHSMRIAPFVEKLGTYLYADDVELMIASLGVDFSQADLCGVN